MARYAQETTVGSDRSKQEIERTLTRYGADQFMYGWRQGGAVIGWRYAGRMYRMDVPMPDRQSDAITLTPTRNWTRSDQQQEQAYEQAIRQRWRAAALWVKATLEAVESGITTIESAFLSNTLLPDGQTVAQWAEPQITQVYATGSMPKQLPGFGRLQLEGGQEKNGNDRDG